MCPCFNGYSFSRNAEDHPILPCNSKRVLFFSFNVVKKVHHTLLTLLGKHPLCCSFSFARPVHSSHTHRHIWSTVKQSPSCLSRSCLMSKRKSPSIPEELQHTFVRRLLFLTFFFPMAGFELRADMRQYCFAWQWACISNSSACHSWLLVLQESCTLFVRQCVLLHSETVLLQCFICAVSENTGNCRLTKATGNE